MIRYALKSLLARKLRLALSAIAIVLGVAMVSGTYVFTDTLGKVFTDLFSTVNRDVAVVVRAPKSFTPSGGGQDDSERLRPALDDSLVAKVRSVPGVKAAVPVVQGIARVVDPADPHKVLGNGGAPTLGFNYTPDLSTLTLREGHAPHGPSELVLDRATATSAGIRVGASVQVLTDAGPPAPFTVVGLVGVGSTDSFGGATVVAFDTPTAQRLLLSSGKVSQIEASATDGVDQATLAARVRSALGPGAEVVTGSQYAKENADQIKDSLGFLSKFLTAFGYIALFVGLFIIFNTFSMLVGQRTRELALLRALGASRGQLVRSVELEAAGVGLVGATVGLAAGVGIAVGLKALLAGVGVDVPSGSLVFAARTVILAYVIGVGVTLAAALLPALQASRVPPVAALRETYVLPSRPLRRRGVVGLVVMLAGVVCGAIGTNGRGSPGAITVGIGAGLVFVGVVVLSPLLAAPMARLLGAPVRRGFRKVGVLASANAARNPRRTAATATALMIGMTLVCGVAVLAWSIKSSVRSVVATGTGADFIVTPSGGFGGLLPPVLTDELRHQPGVAAASGVASVPVQLGGTPTQGFAVQPAALRSVIVLQPSAGNLDQLGPTTLLVSRKTADERGWHVGDRLPATFQNGRTTLRLAGIYRENPLAGGVMLDRATVDPLVTRLADAVALVRLTPDADAARVRQHLQAVVARYPGLQLQDRSQYVASQVRQVNQLLGLVTGLLLLSVAIATFGITNTLALSIIERTHEIGLLRAVGMSRRQLRRMVRLEAVIIASYGAVLGVVIGSVFGWAILRPLRDQGLTRFSYPVGVVVAALVGAAVVGVLAAVFPARRAARLDVLQAIATA